MRPSAKNTTMTAIGTPKRRQGMLLPPFCKGPRFRDCQPPPFWQAQESALRCELSSDMPLKPPAVGLSRILSLDDFLGEPFASGVSECGH